MQQMSGELVGDKEKIDPLFDQDCQMNESGKRDRRWKKNLAVSSGATGVSGHLEINRRCSQFVWE